MVSDSDNTDNEENTPPKKKSKSSIKYAQNYNSKWELNPEFRGWLKPNSKDVHSATCSACDTIISIKSGKLQLQRHANSSKHIKVCSLMRKQPTLRSLPSVSGQSKLDMKVRDGEIRMAAFVTEHNLPFKVMDHLPQLVRAICDDSEIAKRLISARTKTTQIVKNVLGKESHENLTAEIQRKQFSLIVDESTDRACIKHLCLVVRFVSDDYSEIKDCFFAMIPVQEATADALFKHIVAVLEGANIPWKENIIGFAADGANTMMGRSHSLQSLLQAEIPHLFVMKCICHSFHLCASYACLKLPRSVEDSARNIYNYFSNSPKRRGHLKEFQHFVDVQPHKLLHPAQTRWLSLKQVIDRLLEQYNALKLFFTDAVAHDRVLAAENILTSLNDPINKMFLEFLAYVLPIFCTLNVTMQSEEPQIHKFHRNISMALKTILDCYMKPEYLRATPLSKVEYRNPSFFLQIENIYCGAKLAVFLTDPNLPADGVQFFRLRCLDFYIESASQMIKRFPLDDITIKNLEILDPFNVRNTASVAMIAARFPNILPPSAIQDLNSQWRMLRNSDIDSNEKSVMTFWKKVSLIKSGDSLPMFPLVIKLVFSLLSLPHSSANVERVFSTVNNLKTDSRNKLGTKTIEGCLHTKRLLRNSACHNFPIQSSLRNRMNVHMYHDDSS